MTITSAAATFFSAIAARVHQPGVQGSLAYVAGTANSGSGATPTLSTAVLANPEQRVGDVACLALGVGTGLFAASLANYPASGYFRTNIGQGASSPSTHTGFAINNDNSRTAWIAWADILGPSIIQVNGVGTWTNYTHVNIIIPPRRRQGVQYR